jgi:hypothetical protein
LSGARLKVKTKAPGEAVPRSCPSFFVSRPASIRRQGGRVAINVPQYGIEFYILTSRPARAILSAQSGDGFDPFIEKTTGISRWCRSFSNCTPPRPTAQFIS